ncbi:ATP-binding protein, partial [Prosthecobacter sp.]|uniref:sensor histidine kinase n=1 Tax=Prosthecobacter sp. TaxID=1965333 RepID=UPI002487A6EB
VVMIATTLSDVCGQRSDPEMAGKLKEIATLIRSATNDARDVARALHPMDVDASGLVASLRNLVSSYDVPGRVRCALFCHEAIPVRDNDVAMHLYRIVLEALVNASRHSQARHINVHLGVRQQDIILSITDDGVGLPPDHDQSAGIGLKLMRCRASSIGATLSITARPTGGTVVRCSLPAKA